MRACSHFLASTVEILQMQISVDISLVQIQLYTDILGGIYKHKSVSLKEI